MKFYLVSIHVCLTLSVEELYSPALIMLGWPCLWLLQKHVALAGRPSKCICAICLCSFTLFKHEKRMPQATAAPLEEGLYNRPQLPPLHPKLNYQHSLFLLNQPKTGFHHILSTFKILQHRMLVVELITVGRVLRSFYKMILAQRKTNKQKKSLTSLKIGVRRKRKSINVVPYRAE